jgi:DnaK suppressor protein
MKPDRALFREQLNAELQQLAGTIAQAGLSAGTVELDQSSVGRVSRMDALMQQAMAKGMQERLVTRVRKLQAALVRMEAGTYPLSQNSCRFQKLRMIRVKATLYETKHLPCRIQRTGTAQST